MSDLDFALRRSLQLAEEGPEVLHEAASAAAAASAPVCPSCNRPVKHRKGVDWCRDHQMSERTLQDRVRDRAKRRGWTVAHAGKGWVGDRETGVGQFVTPMMKGWPDLFLLNPACKAYKVFWLELKTEEGQPDDDQMAVMQLLLACGIPGALIRPSDLREGRVNAILEGR